MACRNPASVVMPSPPLRSAPRGLAFEAYQRPPRRPALRVILLRPHRRGFRVGQLARPHQVIEPLHLGPLVRLLDRVQDGEVLPEIDHVGAYEREPGVPVLII